MPGVPFLPGYSMGTPARMGPGFFPFYLGVLLTVLGAWITATGLKVHANDPGKVEKFHWKPIFWVLASIVVFGLVLKTVGMLLAGIYHCSRLNTNTRKLTVAMFEQVFAAIAAHLALVPTVHAR